MVKVKICGITNKDDAREAVRLGADMLGFVFYKRSPRAIGARDVKAVIEGLPSRVKKVGVFVNEDRRTVQAVARHCHLDMVQLHGEEPPGYCASLSDGIRVVKAFRVKGRKDLAIINAYDADFYLLDSYARGRRGGTGKSFDWGIVKDFSFRRPVILSGGLTPGNVARAIRKVSPYGVDVSTGVEASPGKKDPKLMRRFIERARRA
jgi:phosphoribosylanthranilate isomerase